MTVRVVVLPDRVMCGDCGRAMHTTGSWEVNPNRRVFACTNGRCPSHLMKVEVPAQEVELPGIVE